MKLIEQVRHTMRLRRLSRKTEQCYVQWITRFLKFHTRPADMGAHQPPHPNPLPRQAGGEGVGKLIWRHPNDMDEVEVREFLTDLAVNGKVSASTQNQALVANAARIRGPVRSLPSQPDVYPLSTPTSTI